MHFCCVISRSRYSSQIFQSGYRLRFLETQPLGEPISWLSEKRKRTPKPRRRCYFRPKPLLWAPIDPVDSVRLSIVKSGKSAFGWTDFLSFRISQRNHNRNTKTIQQMLLSFGHPPDHLLNPLRHRIEPLFWGTTICYLIWCSPSDSPIKIDVQMQTMMIFSDPLISSRFHWYKTIPPCHIPPYDKRWVQSKTVLLVQAMHNPHMIARVRVKMRNFLKSSPANER